MLGVDGFFLPQKVYMPQGTLGESLCYPVTRAEVQTDAMLLQVCVCVSVSHVSVFACIFVFVCVLYAAWHAWEELVPPSHRK